MGDNTLQKERMAIAKAAMQARLDAKPPIEEKYIKFENAFFVGFLSSSMEITKNGDLKFEVTVPYKFYEEAIPLRAALGVPCQFLIESWANDW